jgi:hypothetical protein
MRKHIDQFVKLRCAPDILPLFPNAKEITESMAAFDAMRDIVMPKTGICYDDPGVTIGCVGDGHTPRTAALFAHRSKWLTYSIDPAMRHKEYFGKFERVNPIAAKAQDCSIAVTGALVLVLVHSHATIEQAMAAFSGWSELHIIAIPCCVPQDIPGKWRYSRQDTNIWSPKNEVRVWLNI